MTAQALRVGVLLLGLLGGCESPSCARLREAVCAQCGSASATCTQIQDKTDRDEACTQALDEFNTLLKRLESVPADEKAARLARMCGSNPP